jgi:hypothetical protein
MILAGRYEEAMPFTLDLEGEAFGKPVNYQYSPQLSDSSIEKYSFVPKIWAKKKIEKLLTDYYLLNSSTAQADSVKEAIIDISLGYRVISPFTSFQGSIVVEYDDRNTYYDPGGGKVVSTVMDPYEFDETAESPNQLLLLARSYPNPFSHSTTISFKVTEGIYEPAIIRIFDTTGRLVGEFSIRVEGEGEYELFWNPALNTPALPPGMYAYTISLKGETLSGRMVYQSR